eukprot:TRINITY_DN112306_c0_g1_i1.p1 TRINITY_DN112306_c0_g1~~TRINITY_DN112306_c0_g1_i1.p1  ORF type:complete len:267 (+),score=36.46 TRINITY_DN112306_c0_g1_i1:115-915(+)
MLQHALCLFQKEPVDFQMWFSAMSTGQCEASLRSCELGTLVRARLHDIACAGYPEIFDEPVQRGSFQGYRCNIRPLDAYVYQETQEYTAQSAQTNVSATELFIGQGAALASLARTTSAGEAQAVLNMALQINGVDRNEWSWHGNLGWLSVGIRESKPFKIGMTSDTLFDMAALVAKVPQLANPDSRHDKWDTVAKIMQAILDFDDACRDDASSERNAFWHRAEARPTFFALELLHLVAAGYHYKAERQQMVPPPLGPREPAGRHSV